MSCEVIGDFKTSEDWMQEILENFYALLLEFNFVLEHKFNQIFIYGTIIPINED